MSDCDPSTFYKKGEVYQILKILFILPQAAISDQQKEFLILFKLSKLEQIVLKTKPIKLI